jgi:hypothetical protein
MSCERWRCACQLGSLDFGNSRICLVVTSFLVEASRCADEGACRTCIYVLEINAVIGEEKLANQA